MLRCDFPTWSLFLKCYMRFSQTHLLRMGTHLLSQNYHHIHREWGRLGRLCAAQMQEPHAHRSAVCLPAPSSPTGFPLEAHVTMEMLTQCLRNSAPAFSLTHLPSVPHHFCRSSTTLVAPNPRTTRAGTKLACVGASPLRGLPQASILGAGAPGPLSALPS